MNWVVSLLFFSLLSLRVFASAPEPIPDRMQYLTEVTRYSVNEVNQARIAGLAEEHGYLIDTNPQFVSSDILLFTDRFESVIFVSANRRVNPEYLGRTYTLSDGVLAQRQSGRQQLAVFFLNVKPEIQDDFIRTLGESSYSSVFSFVLPRAPASQHVQEIGRTTPAQSGSSGKRASEFAYALADSFGACALGVVEGANAAIAYPFVTLYKGVRDFKGVGAQWEAEVAAVRKVRDSVINYEETIRQIKDDHAAKTPSEKSKAYCSIVGPGGLAGKAVKTAQISADPTRASRAGASAIIKGSAEAHLKALETYLAGNYAGATILRHAIIRDGKRVTLKIGFLYKKDRKLMLLMERAIKSGAIDVIQAGDIVGPKVLHLLVRLSEVAPPHKRLVIKGETHPVDLVESLNRDRDNKYQYFDRDTWSAQDLANFDDAINKLGMKQACKKLFNAPIERCRRMNFEFDAKAPEQIQWSPSR